MNHRALALLAFLAALAGCVAMPAAPEPSASSSPEPLRRAVPTPRSTVIATKAPNVAERIDNVSPHMFRLKDKLYITFFFSRRTGEQIFFEDLPFEVSYQLYPPEPGATEKLVDQDVEMTADEQRFVVTLPASPAVTDKVRCVYAAGLPDGRRLNGDTVLEIKPERPE